VYGKNACAELRDAFRNRPFQGQDPRAAGARAIFLGLDANYPNTLNVNTNFLAILLRYHDNGVQFWENDQANHNQKHHPFLLNCFPFDRRRDGYKYHRRFDEIGFTPANAYAQYISFLELLAVPTTNDARPEDQTSYEDLLMQSRGHLKQYVQSSMAARTPKAVFLSSDVINRYNQAIDFEMIGGDLLPNPTIVNNEPVLIGVRNRAELYKCYHLSIRKNNHDVREHLRHIKEIVDRIIAI
jgi:hypothetical protein